MSRWRLGAFNERGGLLEALSVAREFAVYNALSIYRLEWPR